MRIQSELHIGSHPDRDTEAGYSFTNGEPHAMGLIKVPLEDIGSHPKLQEIYEALPQEGRDFVQKEGNLALSHDFTFNEDYKVGLGMVIEDLSLDVSRLKDGDKQAVGDWMQQQYGVSATSDADLQKATDGKKQDIITDMSFAGMSQEFMTDLIAEHTSGKPKDERDYGLVPPESMDKMYDSLKGRLGLSDSPDMTPGSEDMQKIGAYHDNVATMGDRWPSAKSENYGREEPGQGEVIFFKGFEANGGEYVKAGPYAYSAAWPGNAEYDKNGIARDDDGNVVKPSQVEADPDYVYIPNGVMTREAKGEEATKIIDKFLEGGVTAYDGFDKNCAGVSGRAVFGEAFEHVPERGKKNDQLWDPAHMQSMNDNGQLPEGMGFKQVEVQGTDLTIDQNALHASTKAVAAQQGQEQQRSQGKTSEAEKPRNPLAGLGAEAIGKAMRDSGVSAGAARQSTGVAREQTGRGVV